MVCNEYQIGLAKTGWSLGNIGKIDDGDIAVGDIADEFGSWNRKPFKDVFCFRIQRPLCHGNGWVS